MSGLFQELLFLETWFFWQFIGVPFYLKYGALGLKNPVSTLNCKDSKGPK
jgi:hypothetical protein